MGVLGAAAGGADGDATATEAKGASLLRLDEEQHAGHQVGALPKAGPVRGGD